VDVEGYCHAGAIARRRFRVRKSRLSDHNRCVQRTHGARTM
jgi:hypothetical protein